MKRPIISLILFCCTKALYGGFICNGGSGGGVIQCQERVSELHQAVRTGNIERARTLLNQGALVDECDSYGLTPLHRAIQDGNLPLVEILVEHGASLTAECYGCFPLHRAALHGHVAIVRLLLNKGAQANQADSSGKTPLHCARTGLIAKLLIENGADVTAQQKWNGKTPLDTATEEGRTEVAQVLRSLLQSRVTS